MLIAASIGAVIILAVFSIDTVSRQFYDSSQRKALVINEASFLIEHINKHACKAIGYGSLTEGSMGFNVVGSAYSFRYNPYWVSTPGLYTDDENFTYSYDGVSRLTFTNSADGIPQVISRRVTSFNILEAADLSSGASSLTVDLVITYDPGGKVSERLNPTVHMNSGINMPQHTALPG